MNWKELGKDLLSLDKALIVPTWAPKLQKYAKVIWYVGLVLIVLMLIGALVTLVRGAVSMAIIQLVLTVLELAIIRMFCEFLAGHTAAAAPAKAEKAEKAK